MTTTRMDDLEKDLSYFGIYTWVILDGKDLTNIGRPQMESGLGWQRVLVDSESTWMVYLGNDLGISCCYGSSGLR